MRLAIGELELQAAKTARAEAAWVALHTNDLKKQADFVAGQQHKVAALEPRWFSGSDCESQVKDHLAAIKSWDGWRDKVVHFHRQLREDGFKVTSQYMRVF